MTTERRTCPRCGVEVIAGRTDLGFDVQLDLTELDPDGELAAALAGRPTYTRHTWADAIAHRGPYQIRQAPAGSKPRTAVHPAHECTERHQP